MSHPHELNSLVRSPSQGYKKSSQLKQKKNPGVYPRLASYNKARRWNVACCWAITRLYQITGMLRIPN